MSRLRPFGPRLGLPLAGFASGFISSTGRSARSASALRALAIPLSCSGAAALTYGALFLLKAMRHGEPPAIATGPPFKLKAALLLSLMPATVLILAAALNAWLGEKRIVMAALVSGLADTHAAAAPVASLAAAGKIGGAQTVVPVLAALSANTVSKAVFAWVNGGRRFAAQVIPGLLLLAAAWAGYALAAALGLHG
jgi:uncharacterized membrane protein (DUF4010 family)